MRRPDWVQCEKHGKKEEALAKLKSGAKFDDVAKEFSEDKARAGLYCDCGRGKLVADEYRWRVGLEEERRS